ncbi:MAG: hypothetical protein MI975_28345 [Cytophagales bacterium]|nr:hypothetical protein [Cytophagales bacterium]
MKKLFLSIPVFFLMSEIVNAQKIRVTVSPSDASIYMNGERLSSGSADIQVRRNDCVTLEAFKPGFLHQEVKFCNKKGYAKPPKTYYFNLALDDSYSASVEGNDIANLDILIRTEEGRDELETWREINQIITSYFDIIEVADRESGYLRTSWHVKSFAQRTVRTRVILKLATTKPVSYKLKILCENAYGKGVSVKSDERFTPWDRVLKTHAGIIEEVQTRLK